MRFTEKSNSNIKFIISNYKKLIKKNVRNDYSNPELNPLYMIYLNC